MITKGIFFLTRVLKRKQIYEDKVTTHSVNTKNLLCVLQFDDVIGEERWRADRIARKARNLPV